MKPPFPARAPAFDAQAIQSTIQRALASAGLDTTSGPLQGLSQTLQRALGTPGTAGPAPLAPGRFERHEFSHPAGRRAYKVYVPAGAAAAPRALLVMLHGCTQSADDFAVGTQMNRLAEQQGLLVLYPEQAAQANASRCWNWFQPQDQRRGAGEPALLAGLVRAVAAEQGADPGRIFVAGLSAGAAMAVVLGQTYPELFAGVGVHSGLPYGSAHDMPSALAAMKGGRGLSASPAFAATDAGASAAQPLPVIVFHGDRDHTVQASNGERIVQQALAAHAAHNGGTALVAQAQEGSVPGGRRFSRVLHTDAAGQARVEHWTVHGAGHAWSGGDPGGSFTDRSGPDASAEMLRFFLSLPRR